MRRKELPKEAVLRYWGISEHLLVVGEAVVSGEDGVPGRSGRTRDGKTGPSCSVQLPGPFVRS